MSDPANTGDSSSPEEHRSDSERDSTQRDKNEREPDPPQRDPQQNKTPLFPRAALFYAQRLGWKVFPLVPGKKTPLIPKHKGGDGYKNATSDLNQIRDWWEKTPQANIGIWPGGSGFFAVDIDVKDGSPGEESWEDLLRKNGPVPHTVEAITGTKGRHILFKRPNVDLFAGANGFAPGIDIKADRGYIVVAPSVHPDTKLAYQWEISSRPTDVAIAEPPAWLVEAILGHQGKKTAYAGPTRGEIVEKSYLSVAFEAAGMLGKRVRGTEKTCVICPWEHEHTSGEQFDTSTVLYDPNPQRSMGWFKCSHSHCEHRTVKDVLAALPRSAIAEADRVFPPKMKAPSGAAVSAVERPVPPPQEEKELVPPEWVNEWVEPRAEKSAAPPPQRDAAPVPPPPMGLFETFQPQGPVGDPVPSPVEPPPPEEDGKKKKKSKKRPEADGGGRGGGRNNGGGGGGGENDGGQPPGEFVDFGYDYTDHKIFADALQRDLETPESPLMFDEGEFWVYDRQVGVWKKVSHERVESTIASYSGTYYDYVDDRGETKWKCVKIKHSDVSGSLKVFRSRLVSREPVRKFANAKRGVAFKNGFAIVDNGRIRLRPHREDHYCRSSFDFDFSSQSQHPKLDKFLDDVFGDTAEEEREARKLLLQEFIGACLVGEATRYQKCLILHGSGGNGKSQILEIARSVFPPNTVISFPPQEWGQRFMGVRLVGALANFCDEIPERDITAGDVFKSIITGDPRHCDVKNKPPMEFVPIAGHIFSANTLPGTVDQSPGFWDRWVAVPLTRNFRELPERRLNIAKEIIAEERPGIIRWALEGAARLQEKGHYEVSEESTRLMDNWRNEADVVRAWIIEVGAKLLLLPELLPTRIFVTTKNLYANFREWSRQRGHQDMTISKFGRRLSSCGLLTPDHNVAGNTYVVRAPLVDAIRRDGISPSEVGRLRASMEFKGGQDHPRWEQSTEFNWENKGLQDHSRRKDHTLGCGFLWSFSEGNEGSDSGTLRKLSNGFKYLEGLRVLRVILNV